MLYLCKPNQTKPGQIAPTAGSDGGVLHVWLRYGKNSEIWLYRLLSRMTRYSPHILSERPHDLRRAQIEQPWPADRISFFRIPSWPSRIGALLNRMRRSVFCPGLALPRSILARKAEEGGFAIIHLHSARSVLWELLDDIRIPKVISFYGTDLLRNTDGRYARRLARLMSKPYWFVVLSEALKEAFIKKGGNPGRVRVIPVGIDLDDFPDEDALRAARNRRNAARLKIVTIGRLVGFKAPQELPRVAAMLVDRGVDCEWTLAGDGPLRNEVIANVERYRVQDRFHLTGNVPFERVRSLISDADVMVHNAIVAPDGTRESLGVALMEAGAFGVPVVSCRVGGIPEVIADRETGFLVPERELDTMSGRIAELARDSELRLRLGLAARARVSELFDSRRIAARMEAFYDEILQVK